MLFGVLLLVWAELASAQCHPMPACEGGNAPPSIGLTSPSNGASSFAPGSFTVSATASDDGEVDGVEFFSNGVSIGVDSSAPYAIAYGGLAVGTYAIQAKATDDEGLSKLSTIATVTVVATPNVPPTITLTGPNNADSSAAPGAFVMTATAGDSDGVVSSVKFMSGSTVLNTDTSYPYAFVYSGIAAGSYALKAVATDNSGAQTTSATANVTVTSASGTPPTVSLTSPLNGYTGTPTGPFSLSANASDSDGIRSVTFLVDGTIAYIDTAAPFTYFHTTGAPGTFSVAALATDNNGATALSAPAVITIATPPAVALTRSYIYDTNQRLCVTINPESGATVVAYDLAGNISWVAEGLPSTTLCDRPGVPESAKTYRLYDQHNRLTKVEAPGTTADIETTYYLDGLVQLQKAWNADGTVVESGYTYNNRRLLTQESHKPSTFTWYMDYAYNANGHRSSQTYPGAVVVGYAPDGLGRPTQVGSFASNISYYPNGAIAQFTYGNGITHAMTPNLRRLPQRSLDSYVTTGGATVKVLDDTYDFDANGNVTLITDQAQAGATTRGMSYDGLDRLAAAVSPLWDTALYSYDALDNLRTASLGVSGYLYNYDPGTNRLASLTRTGGGTFSLNTDARGRVTYDSLRSQSYAFDALNRMTAVTGKETYLYDGQGRRALSRRVGTSTSDYFWYNQAGQLVQDWSDRRAKRHAYIYLGNTLVATYGVTISGPTQGAVAVLYQHTDALGSPVAITDAAKQVVSRTSFTPYGIPMTPVDGVGYTGHEMDIQTGLTYMQQRYYDPAIGRFLIVDPIPADPNSGEHFNLYRYANNNPYRFTDPDGRQSAEDKTKLEGCQECTLVYMGDAGWQAVPTTRAADVIMTMQSDSSSVSDYVTTTREEVASAADTIKNGTGAAAVAVSRVPHPVAQVVAGGLFIVAAAAQAVSFAAEPSSEKVKEAIVDVALHGTGKIVSGTGGTAEAAVQSIENAGAIGDAAQAIPLDE